MSYHQGIANLYRRERYFSLAGDKYKYIGQLKINKISCPRTREVESEREFREFFQREASTANFSKYMMKFQVDYRKNSNDAIAFVTFEINADHLAAIERLDEVKFMHKYLSVRANGFTNATINNGTLADIVFPYQRELVAQFNEEYQPAYQLNAYRPRTDEAKSSSNSSFAFDRRFNYRHAPRPTKRLRDEANESPIFSEQPAATRPALELMVLKTEQLPMTLYATVATSTTGLAALSLVETPEASPTLRPSDLEFYS